MRTKDSTVETNFHPMITQLQYHLDPLYRGWGSELIITSGSEQSTKHSVTSLHYATPAQAFDSRTWQIANVPTAKEQHKYLVNWCVSFCTLHKIPANWVEVILESDHIHIEYQPKRLGS